MKIVTGWIILAITAGLVVLGGLTYWHWAAPARSLRPVAGTEENISISTSADAKSALLFIAEDKGYFSKNGLKVELKTFASGKKGVEQLKTGKIEIANAADFVLVSEVFNGNTPLRCLGAIAAADDHQVIARKDRGILAPGDLRGKKIGAPRGTSAEFLLGRFLAFNDLKMNEVIVSDINPSDQEEALATSRVDAVVVWEQWAYAIKKRLEDTVNWPAQSGQKYYWLLMSTDTFVKDHPELLKSLFKSLEQAEIFLKSHREESIEIIARRINLEPDIIKDSLNRSTLALSLNQALLIMMEDEARWIIENHLTNQTRVPNYLNYIDAEALLRANPKAVALIIPRKAAPE